MKSKPTNLNKKNNQNQASVFLNKRKIIGILVWSIVLIILIAIVISYVIDLNFKSLISSIQHVSTQNPFLAFALCYAVFYFIINFYIRISLYLHKLGKHVKNVRWYQWIWLSSIAGFFQIITPFAIGSEPYIIWWLRQKKISIEKILPVVGVNMLSWSSSQILITWPSFIVFSIQQKEAIANGEINLLYYSVLTGLIIDILVFTLFWGSNYSRHVHVFISVIINFFKKLFRFKFLTKEEIVEKYLAKADYKQRFKNELLQWSSLYNFILQALNSLSTYALFVFLYIGFNNSYVPKTWPQIFNIVNIGATANNFVPIPSTEGTFQYVIKNLIEFVKRHEKDILHIKNDVLPNAIFMLRFFTNYLLFFSVSVVGILLTIKFVFIKWINPKIKYKNKNWFTKKN